MTAVIEVPLALGGSIQIERSRGSLWRGNPL
jgi:hypothetical protein